MSAERPFETKTVHQIVYYDLEKALKTNKPSPARRLIDALENERAANETSNGDVLELEINRAKGVDEDSMWPAYERMLLFLVSMHGWPEGTWQVHFSW